MDALYFLTETHDTWSGKSAGFPYAGDSSIVISENVLRHDSVAEILSQYYEWHYVNPTEIAASWDFRKEAERGELAFFSEEIKGGFPEWFDSLDDTKKALIREISEALAQGLSVLPTIGLRTLLELVIVEKIGDIGGFGKKLTVFADEGYATKKDAELLAAVLDAGNAAAHRAYFPNVEDLRTCVEVTKHVIKGIYILRPRIEVLKKNTPKRDGI